MHLLYKEEYPVSCPGVYNLNVKTYIYRNISKRNSAVKKAVLDSLPNERYGHSPHMKVFHRVVDTARLILNKRIPEKHIANVSVPL